MAAAGVVTLGASPTFCGIVNSCSLLKCRVGDKRRIYEILALVISQLDAFGALPDSQLVQALEIFVVQRVSAVVWQLYVECFHEFILLAP